MMMNHPEVTSEEVFIAEMIPHHQEAVDSSRLMLDSQNPEVKALAESIIQAQEVEISLLKDWMRQWYQDSDHVIAYQNMMPDLTALQGSEKDKAFLEGMIHHHEGAVQMANQALKLDLRAEVAALAENIVTTQKAEMDLMKQLLKNP
jgi:uncharacterized protein (DUF305 family)